MTLDALSYSSIEEFLGSDATRFFGRGHTRVHHELSDLEILRRGDRGAIRAQASLAYPSDWSRKSAGSPHPHLSSIDALMIAVELAEAYLTHTHDLGSDQRRCCWLRSIQMRVGTPQQDLRAFDVEAECLPADGAAGRAGLPASAFRCRIGTVRVALEIEYPAPRLDVRPGSYAVAEDVLGAAVDRYYGDRYKERTQRVRDVRLATDLRSIQAVVVVRDAVQAGCPDPGFAGAYQPSISMLDALLALAQLSQTLAYRLDGIERDVSNTLWLRRLAMWSDAPLQPMDGAIDASLAIVDARRQALHGRDWRALEVSGRLGGVRLEAAIAHELPTPGLRSVSRPARAMGPGR